MRCHTPLWAWQPHSRTWRSQKFVLAGAISSLWIVPSAVLTVGGLGIGGWELENQFAYDTASKAQDAAAYCACLNKRSKCPQSSQKGETAYQPVNCTTTPTPTPLPGVPTWPNSTFVTDEF
jgi:hypothetical protein